MEVEVLVTGDEQTEAMVARLSRRLADGSSQLRGLVDLLLEAHQDRYRYGRGARWKRIAASTLRKDAREGRDPRPMISTGALMRSLTVRGAKGQIIRVTPTTLTFGTRVWYAKFHKQGKGVPKRAPVGLTRRQRQNIVTELRDLLLEDARD